MPRSIYSKAALVALAIVAVALVPSASASCTYTSVARIGEGADRITLGVGQCETEEHYTYTGDEVGGSEQCATVPRVEVLDTEVPGTGDTYCAPVPSVSLGSGVHEGKSIGVCLNDETPPCGPSAYVLSPECLAYIAIDLVQGTLESLEVGSSQFRCYVFDA